jgi:tricorn protease
MTKQHLIFAVILGFLISVGVSAQGTRMLRHPAVSRDLVAFEYAGDLWSVSRGGGTARRLTSTPGVEIDPYFSPDGSQIAFTATGCRKYRCLCYADGGRNPRRLTFHPGSDRVNGWTPDGRFVIFSAPRENSPQGSILPMWKIAVGGGHPNRFRCLAYFPVHFRRTGINWLIKNFRLCLFRHLMR